MAEYWIPRGMKKGALHRQLGIPQDEKIPLKTLDTIVRTSPGKSVMGPHGWVKVTPLMKKRANMARNLKRL